MDHPSPKTFDANAYIWSLHPRRLFANARIYLASTHVACLYYGFLRTCDDQHEAACDFSLAFEYEGLHAYNFVRTISLLLY